LPQVSCQLQQGEPCLLCQAEAGCIQTDSRDPKVKAGGIRHNYCFSRKIVETITQGLESAGFRALPYHAGLSSNIRSKNQEKFIKDDVEVLVATIAFGMGIDKPNIRFVIHTTCPKTLNPITRRQDAQAGMIKSECVLFYSYGDRQKIEYS